VSASANNEYHLKVASDNMWPQFIINNGYDEDEFQAWVKEFKFFENDPKLQEVQNLTRCIPYEMSLLLAARASLQLPTLDMVIKKYCSSKEDELFAQQRKFQENHIKTQADLKNAIEAVTVMMLGLPTAHRTCLMNQQLMYKENGRIYPIHPLAGNILKAFWGDMLETELHTTTKAIFSSPDFTSDTTGRVK
jgi:hypothetical protein